MSRCSQSSRSPSAWRSDDGWPGPSGMPKVSRGRNNATASGSEHSFAMSLGYQTGTGSRPSESRLQRDHGTDAARGRDVGERLVDLGERATRRDHAFEVELTRAPQVEQARDVAAAVAGTEERAHQLALENHEQHCRVQPNTLIDRRGADHHRRTAVAR